MKKLFAIIIICFIIQYNSSAQEFNAGISAGLSTSQVSGDNLGGFNKAGIIIGGFVNRKINSLFKVQLEMMFIQKGSSNPKPENLIGEIHLDYIEVPIILSFRNSEKVSLNFGLHISTLIDGYYQDIYGIMENQIEFDRFELGALCGISYQLND